MTSTTPTAPPELLTVQDVSAVLGVGVPVVRRLIKARRLDAINVGGLGRPTWRISRDALRHFTEGR